MKYLLLLTVAIQIASNANGLPLPAGQIVEYRVPTEFFNNKNESNALYKLLSQLHFGGSSPAVTKSPEEIVSEDVTDENSAELEKIANTEKDSVVICKSSR